MSTEGQQQKDWVVATRVGASGEKEDHPSGKPGWPDCVTGSALASVPTGSSERPWESEALGGQAMAPGRRAASQSCGSPRLSGTASPWCPTM